MSTIRKTIHNLLKLSKSVAQRAGDSFTFMMKISLLISLSVLIVLLFFSTTTHHGEKLIEVADTVHPNRDTHLEELNKEEPATNISHILFGIASSANTWADRTQLNRIWWDPNATRGFVWLDEPLAHSESTHSSPLIRVSEDTSRFKYSCSFGNRSAIRIARIVLESFRLGIDDVRWFVMGDEHRRPLYISERGIWEFAGRGDYARRSR
ncbi:hypothetical protein Scep_005438 [Stephania cephalantha]|uniref:Uncharacterized protein n=1 Tax=Stephania cephalantha TaxID=152367 RepID=A0AAP0KXD4_9MAGN